MLKEKLIVRILSKLLSLNTVTDLFRYKLGQATAIEAMESGILIDYEGNARVGDEDYTDVRH